MTRRLILALLLLALAAPALAQTNPIPADRRTDWSYAGVPGGVPTYTTICHTFTPATGTKAAIQAKLAECAATYPTGSVVYLSAGTYTFDGMLGLSSTNVALRGAGANQTTITGTAATNVLLQIGYSGGITTLDRAITSGGVKDTFQFTVASVSGLSVGQIIELERNQASYVYTHYSSGHPQVNRIAAINGTTVTVQNPLIWDYSSSSGGVLKRAWNAYKSGVGLEDLKIDRSNYTGAERQSLNFDFCYGCWMKGVESYSGVGKHIIVETSLNCEIRDSYIHEAKTYGPNNSGIDFEPGGGYGNTSNMKVENTIFDRLFPAVEFYGSTSGNVIAYNYVLRPQTGETSVWVTWSLNDGHAPHPSYNLYEGNISPTFGADGYYGSASHGTAFRNLLSGATMDLSSVIQIGPSVQLKRFNYYYNIVGNVLGSTEQVPPLYEAPATGHTGCGGWCSTPYELGWPNIGNDSMAPFDDWYPTGQSSYPDTVVKSTMFRWGNYDFYYDAVRWDSGELGGVTQPASQALPSSMYLTSKPSWFGAVAWPPIGPDVTATTHGGVGTSDASGHANKTPAQLCWESRNLISGGTFSAASCYYGVAALPNPPTNVRIR